MSKARGSMLPASLAEINTLPATVIHVDLHLDNFMVTQSESPKAAVILDWPSICRGPVAIDLTKFLVGPLAPKDRHAWEMDFIAQYTELLRMNSSETKV